jgi:hypothetical protein
MDCIATLPRGKFIGEECPSCGVPEFNSGAFGWDVDVERPLILRTCTDLSGRPLLSEGHQEAEFAKELSAERPVGGGLYGQLLHVGGQSPTQGGRAAHDGCATAASRHPLVWVNPDGRMLGCVQRVIHRGITRVSQDEYMRGPGRDDALKGERLSDAYRVYDCMIHMYSAIRPLDRGQADRRSFAFGPLNLSGKNSHMCCEGKCARPWSNKRICECLTARKGFQKLQSQPARRRE